MYQSSISLHMFNPKRYNVYMLDYWLKSHFMYIFASSVPKIFVNIIATAIQ